MTKRRLFHPEPDAFALLTLAAKTLRENLAPTLEREQRYEVLLAANAIETAVRELENGTHHDQQSRDDLENFAPGQTLTDLCQAIRQGAYDAHETARELHQILTKITDRALRETHPDRG